MLWKYLCNQTKIMIGSKKCECSNGLGQGSTLSPGLFDVYS